MSAGRVALALAGTLLAAAWGGPVRADGPPPIGVVTTRFLEAGGGPQAVYAQVLGPDGRAAPDGTPVAFLATLGVRFDPPTAGTVAGVAATQAVPGTEAGFARIDAASGDARGHVVLWVRPAPAAHVLWMRAEPESLEPGAQAEIVARLTDAFGNAAEGDVVRWSAGGGEATPTESRVDHGEARTTFRAGSGPAAWVRLEAAGPTARVAIPVAPLDRAALTRRVFLPRAERGARGPAACRDVLANGSFEADDDGDGLPDGWSLPLSTSGAATRVEAGSDGRFALRLVAAGPEPPDVVQAIRLPADIGSAELRLWVRGTPGAGLRLAVWSEVDLGSGPLRAPLLVERPEAPDADWTLLAYLLPVAPAGETTVSIGPGAEGGAAVDVDAVRLEVCGGAAR